MAKRRTTIIVTLACLGWTANAVAVPLGSDFAYQGQLKESGLPYSGAADLNFTLYDAAGGGTIVAGPVTLSAASVVNGLFTVSLDFGASVFGGSGRWLEIAVRTPAGSGVYTTLSPRQALTATPHALYAANAGLLDGLDSAAFLQAIPVPLTLSGSIATQIVSVENAAMDLGSSAIRGRCSAASGLTFGVIGVNDSTVGRGVAGQATSTTGVTYGVQGASASTDGRGVYGTATAWTGSTYGGYFEAASTGATGAYGLASAASGTTYGVYGRSNSTNGHGVFGLASAATGTTFGGYFESVSTSGRAVYASASAASGITYGVYGRSVSPSGRGVYGHAIATTGDARGVFGVSNSASGLGTVGYATAASGTTSGLYGQSDSTSGRGVYGLATAQTGATHGGYFLNDSTSGIGALGWATSATGTTYGLWGQSDSTGGYGVFGKASATSGTNYGGYFYSNSTSGRGVYGYATAASGATCGVYGQTDSSQYGSAGVRGLATASGGAPYGGYFESRGTSGYGVYGSATATGATDAPYGVWGKCSTATLGLAVYAEGDMGASGTKSFRIDHPNDPENKYLLHYSIESPEVLNAYTGKVTLDGRGEATVELPAYFASINKDPRYTLTAIGAPMPMLHVAEEISEQALKAGEQARPGAAPSPCSFRIAGGVAGARVSWEVKAVRNDPRLRVHGAAVEREKTGPERGRYQHPEFYGQPQEKGMNFDVERGRSSAPTVSQEVLQ